MYASLGKVEIEVSLYDQNDWVLAGILSCIRKYSWATVELVSPHGIDRAHASIQVTDFHERHGRKWTPNERLPIDHVRRSTPNVSRPSSAIIRLGLPRSFRERSGDFCLNTHLKGHGAFEEEIWFSADGPTIFFQPAERD